MLRFCDFLSISRQVAWEDTARSNRPSRNFYFPCLTAILNVDGHKRFRTKLSYLLGGRIECQQRSNHFLFAAKLVLLGRSLTCNEFHTH